MKGRPKGAKNGIQQRVDLLCQYCGKEFKVWPYRLSRNDAKVNYCSQKCYHSDSLHDEPNYNALHKWVRDKLGPANKGDKECSCCGSKTNLQWANKSWEYLRDINDWMILCSKCHVAYDKPNLGIATQKYPEIRRQYV